MKTSLSNDKEKEKLQEQKEGKGYKVWRVRKPNMRATDCSDNLESFWSHCNKSFIKEEISSICSIIQLNGIIFFEVVCTY